MAIGRKQQGSVTIPMIVSCKTGSVTISSPWTDEVKTDTIGGVACSRVTVDMRGFTTYQLEILTESASSNGLYKVEYSDFNDQSSWANLGSLQVTDDQAGKLLQLSSEDPIDTPAKAMGNCVVRVFCTCNSGASIIIKANLRLFR